MAKRYISLSFESNTLDGAQEIVNDHLLGYNEGEVVSVVYTVGPSADCETPYNIYLGTILTLSENKIINGANKR